MGNIPTEPDTNVSGVDFSKTSPAPKLVSPIKKDKPEKRIGNKNSLIH